MAWDGFGVWTERKEGWSVQTQDKEELQKMPAPARKVVVWGGAVIFTCTLLVNPHRGPRGEASAGSTSELG